MSGTAAGGRVIGWTLSRRACHSHSGRAGTTYTHTRAAFQAHAALQMAGGALNAAACRASRMQARSRPHCTAPHCTAPHCTALVRHSTARERTPGTTFSAASGVKLPASTPPPTA